MFCSAQHVSKSPNPNLYQRVNIFTTLCMILVFGKLFILIVNFFFPRLIVYLDTIEIYKGFRHSQRSVTFIEKIKMNCINLIFLDRAYNASFFFALLCSIHAKFKVSRYNKLPKYTRESFQFSLQGKKTIEILRMSTSFQVRGKSSVTAVKSHLS